MCAVQGGRSVDTTMGFTPLEGLVMGSRCGESSASSVGKRREAAGSCGKLDWEEANGGLG